MKFPLSERWNGRCDYNRSNYRFARTIDGFRLHRHYTPHRGDTCVVWSTVVAVALVLAVGYFFGGAV